MNQHPRSHPPTYAAQLTPAGRGAVAVVRVAGPQAARAVDACFSAANGRRLDAQQLGTIVFGRWQGAVGEELIVCRAADNEVEVHCHGGGAAADAILGDLAAQGCQIIDWSEWVTHREGDPLVAAALVALADAPTPRTAAILLDQAQGALSRAVRELTDGLHAVGEQAAGTPARLRPWIERIECLLRLAPLGEHLTRPWRVVLAGRPNVGKSSLINAIMGFTRAIVSPTPGTTRDSLTALTAIDGWPVQLADTAGLHEGTDELEQAGIARARHVLAQADLVVYVEEAAAVGAAGDSMELPPIDLPAETKSLHVLNKIDLCKSPPAAGNNCQPVSALTGEGIDALLSAIAHTLVPAPPPPQAAVPFSSEQTAALRRVLAALHAGEAEAGLSALRGLLPQARA